MLLLDRELVAGLRKLCGGRKNHAVYYLLFNVLGPGEDEFFCGADKIRVTVTDSIKLGGFGIGIQGYEANVPQSFETAFIISPTGRLLGGTKMQHATAAVTHPDPREDWSPFLESNAEGIERMRHECSEVVRRTVRVGQKISEAEAASINPLLYFLAHPPMGR